MRIKHDIYIQPEIKKLCKGFVKEKLHPNECNIEAVHLGGSHTKNTSNKDSDIDLRIYYKIPLKSFLKLDIATPSINCESTTDQESKAVTFHYQGKEFEVEFIPLLKNTSFKKELVRCLIQPKADVVFKFVRAYPLIETYSTMKRFRQWIMHDYYWNPDSFFKYFNGYMISQLQRHKRRKDGQRRAMQARKLNSVTPVVKLTIDGLYMALSGILLLEEQAISRNVINLHDKYSHLFTEEQNKFLTFCTSHKLNRTPPAKGTWDWINYAMDMRDELFRILHHSMKQAYADTSIKWYDWMKKENKKAIESWLEFEFYRGEV